MSARQRPAGPAASTLVYVRRLWANVKVAAKSFGQHKVPRLAAALAYYTLFSLAPVLVIVMSVVGSVFGTEEARARLVSQISGVTGADTAQLISDMIGSTQRTGTGLFATVVGIVTLLIGATGVFVQLQGALNEIWEAPQGARRGIVRSILMRLEGLLMVLGMGLAALLAVALQGAVGFIRSHFEDLLPGADWLWVVANPLLSLLVFTLVFAALFKLVPDVQLAWGEVWPGALFTATLFVVGQLGLSLYLGSAGVGSAYGAAGTLVVLVLFVYYSSQIMLFGAEFTRADAQARRLRRGLSDRFTRKP